MAVVDRVDLADPDSSLARAGSNWRGNPVAEWLIDHGGAGPPVVALFDELCQRVAGLGIPLFRVVAAMPTLHPQVATRSLHWQRGRGVESQEREHGIFDSPAYQNSPVALIHQGAEGVRRRLTGPGEALDFPILHELKAAGATDYVALPLRFTRAPRPSFVSWSTDAPDGFTTAQITVIAELMPRIALRFEIEALRGMMQDLLKTYLGSDAAGKVLSGNVRRGSGEPIQAAIWYCDLRGFTALANRLAPAELMALLDDYFDCVARPVQERGGEVLKFVGDAILAIFRLASDGGNTACNAALDAAVDALRRVHVLNQGRALESGTQIDIGIALHVGEVMYGNIGAQDRLDFTVIGVAVNEVTRVEGQCRHLRQPLLVTGAFAACGCSNLVSLGSHRLRDVREPVELFAMPPGGIERIAVDPSLCR